VGEETPSIQHRARLRAAHLSWQSPRSPVPVYPSLAWDNLFDNRGSLQNISILDRVKDRAQDLSKCVSPTDKGKFDEYLTSVREVEKRVEDMTGDPKRQVSFGSYNLNRKPPTALAFDQLTFPACEQCNHDFSDLEGRAREATERLLGKRPLTSTDFNCLLDWLDKVRTGMWLGQLGLEGNPWEIEPKFYVSSRLRLHDRSVGIGFIEGRHPGINLVGPESPCFGLIPTSMCIFINHLALFNSSTIGLCSRRLGFPFPSRFLITVS
jgi:Protein of unknown function (DUF1552)